ncbi:hypothetical protein MXB_3379 [Myxobolus squamalis]|nr:hypothetical protein MXB_3379 [Myxobolus squamalis]
MSKSCGYSPVNTTKKYQFECLHGSFFFISNHFLKYFLHFKIFVGTINSLLLVAFLNKRPTRSIFKLNSIVLTDIVRFYKTDVFLQLFRDHSFFSISCIHIAHS